MSKPSNLINSILRQQELRFSTEGLNEGVVGDTLNFDLTVESLLDQLNVLVGFSKEIKLAGGITRQQALTLESVEGFRLPFPARGFTVEPSRTGYALTSESIGEKIHEGFKKLLEILSGLLDKLLEHLFGGKARAEQAREEMKETKRKMAEAVDEPEGYITDASMLRSIQRVVCLSTKAEAYKGICKDLRKMRLAIAALSVKNGEFDLDQFELTNLRLTAKKAGIDLYADGKVPDRQLVRDVLVKFFIEYEASVKVPGFDRTGKVLSARDALKFYDAHYDKAMATLSAIENALLEQYTHGKETKQMIKRLVDFREVPGMAENVAEVLKLSRDCFYLVNWLNRTLAVKSELKEGA